MDDQAVNIAYLFPRALWCAKMSGGRRWYGQAVARQPGVSVRVWGDGWDGYDSSVSVQTNLERSGEHYDACWLYKFESLIGEAECAVPKFLTFNEACWPDRRALMEAEACGASLVICHHWNDLPQFDGFHGRLVHIPHGSPTEIFDCSKTHAERSTACLSSGVSSKEIYPVRAKLRGLIESGRIPGRIRNHPGYRLPTIEACDRQAMDYAADLQDSRISLCCSSRHHYFLAKAIESALAGCLVVTDAPDDPAYRELLAPHVVEVSPDATADELADKIKWWLANPRCAEELAMRGQKAVRENFTTDHYAARLVAEIRAMLAAR